MTIFSTTHKFDDYVPVSVDLKKIFVLGFICFKWTIVFSRYYSCIIYFFICLFWSWSIALIWNSIYFWPWFRYREGNRSPAIRGTSKYQKMIVFLRIFTVGSNVIYGNGRKRNLLLKSKELLKPEMRYF